MDWATASHTTPHRADPSPPALIRTLWVMTRPPNKSVTAGVYANPFGRELRVYYGQDENNLLDSLLSRTDDAPLEHRASELRAVLDTQGWTPVT